MRLQLAAGIAGTLLVIASAVVLWPKAPAVVRVPPAQVSAAPPQPVAQAAVQGAPAPRAMPAALPRPDGLLLQGVMAHPDAARSQALLGTRGAAAQLYRTGEAVADGWVLRSIGADHVVLAQGGVQARLEVTGQAPVAGGPATVQQGAAAATAQAPATPKNAPPGLVPGPAQPRIAAGTPEANRRFLQDVRARMAAADKQNP